MASLGRAHQSVCAFIWSRTCWMLNEADFCRCGNSLKLIRNCPTMACAGIMTQSLSPYQRAYIWESGVTSNGSIRRLTTNGTVRGFATSAHQESLVAKETFQSPYRNALR